MKFPGVLLLLLLLAGMRVSLADPGDYAVDTDLGGIVRLIDGGDFDSAIDRLHDALDNDPDNADILSLLGYSYRNLSRYDEALTYYRWALRSDPKHKGANEYLGELYLQTDQLDKAVMQLDILDNLCTFGCREHTLLKEAIDNYQQQEAGKS